MGEVGQVPSGLSAPDDGDRPAPGVDAVQGCPGGFVLLSTLIRPPLPRGRLRRAGRRSR